MMVKINVNYIIITEKHSESLNLVQARKSLHPEENWFKYT